MVKDFQDNKYETNEEMCKFYNIPLHIFEDRFYRRQWSLKRSLLTPYHDHQNRYQKVYDENGMEYSSAYDLCAKRNFPIQLYLSRKALGWSPNKIFETPLQTIRTDKYSGVYSHTYNGKDYYSCKERNSESSTLKIMPKEEIMDSS